MRGVNEVVGSYLTFILYMPIYGSTICEIGNENFRLNINFMVEALTPLIARIKLY